MASIGFANVADVYDVPVWREREERPPRPHSLHPPVRSHDLFMDPYPMPRNTTMVSDAWPMWTERTPPVPVVPVRLASAPTQTTLIEDESPKVTPPMWWLGLYLGLAALVACGIRL